MAFQACLGLKLVHHELFTNYYTLLRISDVHFSTIR